MGIFLPAPMGIVGFLILLAITGDLNLGSIGFEGSSPREILNELGMDSSGFSLHFLGCSSMPISLSEPNRL